MIESGKLLRIQKTLFNEQQTILNIEKLRGDSTKFSPLPDELLQQAKSAAEEKIDSITSTQINSPALPQAQEGKLPEIKEEPHEIEAKPQPLLAHIISKDATELVKEVPMKKYTFTLAPDSFIQLPSNYSTDEEHEKRIIDYMNIGYKGWSLMSSENGIDVYKNDDTSVKPLMVKAYVTINYSKDVIFEAIDNLAIRSQWDTIFSNLELVENRPETHQEVLAMIIKSKMPFSSDRDMVQLKTAVKGLAGEKTVLIYSRSIEHKDKPIIKKYVRAILHLGGYYIEEIEPNKCKVAIVNQMDPGLPDFVLNKMMPKTVISWVERVQNGCKIVLAGKK